LHQLAKAIQVGLIKSIEGSFQPCDRELISRGMGSVHTQRAQTGSNAKAKQGNLPQLGPTWQPRSPMTAQAFPLSPAWQHASPPLLLPAQRSPHCRPMPNSLIAVKSSFLSEFFQNALDCPVCRTSIENNRLLQKIRQVPMQFSRFNRRGGVDRIRCALVV
jgi:hypothetical protein